MPRVDWSDGTAWPLYYSGVDGDGYGQRLNRDAIFGKRFRVLTAAFNMLTTDRILVVGCGFGYLIDRFHDAGFANTWGIDSSADIENRKGAEARGSTLWVSDDLTGGGRIRNKLRQLTGDDEFDWIITESMLESYDDNEIEVLLNACETGLAGADESQIIHIVVASPTLDPVFNVKTLAEWKAMRPAHSWTGPIDGWQVL